MDVTVVADEDQLLPGLFKSHVTMAARKNVRQIILVALARLMAAALLYAVILKIKLFFHL